MMDWQPIETAPKNREILVYGWWAGEISGPHLELKGIYLAEGETTRPDYPGYTWCVTGTDAYAAWVKATHWMSAPEIPGP